MAFDEKLGKQIAAELERRSVAFDEKRMFGGLGFMINDKMCIGVVGDKLMLRVVDPKFDEVLARDDVNPMDFTGRPMKGFVYVKSPTALSRLKAWVDLAVEFSKHGKVKTRKRSTLKSS